MPSITLIDIVKIIDNRTLSYYVGAEAKPIYIH